jgi:hypothetical protein
MASRNAGIASAIAIISLGVAWLLNNAGVLPAVEWVWTLGLAIAGVLLIGFLGFDKVTIVFGPFLIIASFFSFLRQTGRISASYEVPILVILFGLLILISVLSPLKPASWLDGSQEPRN